METLDVLLTELTAGLSQAGRQWLRLAEQAMADCGLSGAGAFSLILIWRAGAGLHQVALAEQLGVMGPTLVRQLDKLSESGLVFRETDHADRRANVVRLTESGRRLGDQLEARLTELRRRVFADTPREDLEAVVRVQRMLTAAFAATSAGAR